MEGVALPAKLLGADEHVVIHTRTHVKAMILPALAFVLIAAAVGAGAAVIPREARPIGQLAIALLGVVLAIWLVLLPFLRWRTTTYTITNRRLITRSGILNKIGKDLPLNRTSPFRPGTGSLYDATSDPTLGGFVPPVAVSTSTAGAVR